METFFFFADIIIFLMVTTIGIMLTKMQLGIFQQIKRLEDDVKKGFNDCMTKLEASRIPHHATVIPERTPVINFPKAAKAAKRTYSAEHKAKLSEARKAYWEKKKAAEQSQVTQPPGINQPNVT